MSDLIKRDDAIKILSQRAEILQGEYGDLGGACSGVLKIIESLPSTESETIAIEEVSNQLGCATIQPTLYWFEFLKTLDLLGFAIIRKETK